MTTSQQEPTYDATPNCAFFQSNSNAGSQPYFYLSLAMLPDDSSVSSSSPTVSRDSKGTTITYTATAGTSGKNKVFLLGVYPTTGTIYAVAVTVSDAGTNTTYTGIVKNIVKHQQAEYAVYQCRPFVVQYPSETPLFISALVDVYTVDTIGDASNDGTIITIGLTQGSPQSTIKTILAQVTEASNQNLTQIQMAGESAASISYSNIITADNDN